MTLKADIQIKFNEDYRKIFKKDQTISIPTRRFGIMYLVGPNGCGKSTALRSIRAIKDTLEAQRLADFDGCRSTRISDIGRDIKDGKLEVTGVENFTHVFAFDAEADSNTDVLNAYSAGGFAAGGGFAAIRMSRGQGVLVEFAKFMKRFEAAAAEAASRGGKDWNPLVIIDEIDEGLDIRMQLKYNQVILRKFCLLGASVLVVSHNPICMLSNACKAIGAFDVSTGTIYSNPSDYIESLTGCRITIDNTSEKTMEEQLKFNRENPS